RRQGLNRPTPPPAFLSSGKPALLNRLTLSRRGSSRFRTLAPTNDEPSRRRGAGGRRRVVGTSPGRELGSAVPPAPALVSAFHPGFLGTAVAFTHPVEYEPGTHPFRPHIV